ncbi:YhcN/YlaJ family sporulation lipoprotein [Tepidibacillus sp. LV47]|uniref:YhcN/YlaJ family sporulation lipoprotein n=1 Tax=Tepidibacillus sp. LV47 TaxID=3398228 RepID=UPI003AADC416
MHRRKIFLFVIATLLVLGLVGCNTANRPLTQGYNDRNVHPYAYDGTRYYGTYHDGAPYYGTPNYGPYYNYNRVTPYANVNREADRLADIAARINGVDDATVVIAGGNVYVGIDLNDRIQSGTQSETVERNVYNAVKKAAPRYNVYVTSDADLLGRLRNIGDGIRNGTPIDRFQTDMRDFNTRFRTYTR